MVKIIEKIRKLEKSNDSGPYFSFEFFPPKTEQGLDNLYLRIERMTSLHPLFVDITWGAGGSTKDLSLTIAQYCQTYFGIDVLLHLSCTNITVEEIKTILRTARDAGIQNILALRGDPLKGSTTWRSVPGKHIHICFSLYFYLLI